MKLYMQIDAYGSYMKWSACLSEAVVTVQELVYAVYNKPVAILSK